MLHTPGKWLIGKMGGTVISNEVPESYKKETGHDDIDYYGGFLIGESIRDCDLKLIASAPELLEALLEAKEVLLQLDHRHNGKCYNPGSENCNCTLCKIESVIKKATE
jgi:hypothetical protein